MGRGEGQFSTYLLTPHFTLLMISTRYFRTHDMIAPVIPPAPSFGSSKQLCELLLELLLHARGRGSLGNFLDRRTAVASLRGTLSSFGQPVPGCINADRID